MLIWIVIVLLIGLYFMKIVDKKSPRLQKEDYEKDIIYLVQFPVSPFIRSISPFALKLETYLRLKKICYEPLYSLQFSKKGQIPFIELNGEQIPDSNTIIKELEKRGIAKLDILTEQQKAINHLTKITLENHTSTAGKLVHFVLPIYLN